MKTLLSVQLTLVVGLFGVGCGSETRLVESAPVETGPLSECRVVCDYTHSDHIEIRADAEAAPVGTEGRTNCGSCEGLLNYHAAEHSCDDPSGLPVQVVPFVCPVSPVEQ